MKLVRKTEHRRVCDAPQLRADGGVDRRVSVAVDVAPQRGDAVDVRVAVGVIEVRALGVVDYHGGLLGAPLLLLGERVPQMPAVGSGELGSGAHPLQRSSMTGRNGPSASLCRSLRRVISSPLRQLIAGALLVAVAVIVELVVLSSSSSSPAPRHLGSMFPDDHHLGYASTATVAPTL